MDGAVFRIDGAFPDNPVVDNWFEARDGLLAVLARKLFRDLRAIAPGAPEALADGCPVICVGDAPFAYVNVFTNHLNLGFFRGASLPDPNGLLEGSGKSMRHVKIRNGAQAENPAIQDLMRAAYADMRARA